MERWLNQHRIDILGIFREIPLNQLDDILLQLGIYIAGTSKDEKIELMINTILDSTSKISRGEKSIVQTTLDIG